MYPPKFITIEGIEGVGKSTASEFIRAQLTAANIDFIHTREPGGTVMAEEIRRVLLSHYEESVSPLTELLLMNAGRVQNIEQVIKPALAAGKWVLSDRFADASIAYQGAGRQNPEDVVASLAQFVCGDLKPDLTLLLDAPVDIALGRMMARGERDRIELEGVEFFKRIRQSYLQIAANEPERVVVIDASCDLLSVQQALLAALNKFMS